MSNRGGCRAIPKRWAFRSEERRRWHARCSNGKERSGLMTTTYATAGAFFRSSPDAPVPDLQLVFVIAIVDDHARKLHLGHGISCHVDVLRPYSRGTVGLNSPDARDAPGSIPTSCPTSAICACCSRAPRPSSASSNPGPSTGSAARCCTRRESKDPVGMEKDIRSRADTQYHPVGTCKMGPESDPIAVVEHELRVRGVVGCAWSTRRSCRPWSAATPMPRPS